MNLAVIPARGGSKRIPRKNIKKFRGQPMIAYAITAAKESGLFNYIVVSTDDEEIATVAKEWGAHTPFVRPTELSDDHTSTVPVVAHAIQTCQGMGWQFANVCCIYPTVPFIQTEDLKGSHELLKKGAADYCFPVSEYPSAIQRALRLTSQGRLQSIYPEYESVRTQDLESAYFDAGQFYWGKKQAWMTSRSIHNSAIGYPIPYWRVVDIDSPTDWQRAELMNIGTIVQQQP
jgi:pseudaminic acid cytidylyltransferase